MPYSVNHNVCRIELGPKRRDPLGTFSNKKHKSVLQGASAMGSFAVSCAHERQPPGVKPRSTPFDFGVSVQKRSAHVNRAYLQSSFEGGGYASNHASQSHQTAQRLQNGLPVHSGAVHGVHG